MKMKNYIVRRFDPDVFWFYYKKSRAWGGHFHFFSESCI